MVFTGSKRFHSQEVEDNSLQLAMILIIKMLKTVGVNQSKVTPHIKKYLLALRTAHLPFCGCRVNDIFSSFNEDSCFVSSFYKGHITLSHNLKTRLKIRSSIIFLNCWGEEYRWFCHCTSRTPILLPKWYSAVKVDWQSYKSIVCQ